MIDLNGAAETVWNAWEKAPVSLDFVQADREALAAALKAAVGTLPKPESKTNTEYDRGYRAGIALIHTQLWLMANRIESPATPAISGETCDKTSTSAHE
jgi:hypothetical protein